MRLVFWGLLALTCGLLPVSHALKVVVGPGKTECVAETVDQEHFEIPGGARIEGAAIIMGYSEHYHPSVTLRVLSPQGDQMWQQQNTQQEVHFNIAARGPGTYKVCFFNAWESRVDATIDLVYFTLGHLRRHAGTVQIPKGSTESRSKEVAQKEHIEDFKRTVMGMAEMLEIIQGEQRYLQRKIARHAQTVRSNTFRTTVGTFCEVAAIAAMCGAQVYTIRRFFSKGTIRLSV